MKREGKRRERKTNPDIADTGDESSICRFVFSDQGLQIFIMNSFIPVDIYRRLNLPFWASWVLWTQSSPSGSSSGSIVSEWSWWTCSENFQEKLQMVLIIKKLYHSLGYKRSLDIHLLQEWRYLKKRQQETMSKQEWRRRYEETFLAETNKAIFNSLDKQKQTLVWLSCYDSAASPKLLVYFTYNVRRIDRPLFFFSF